MGGAEPVLHKDTCRGLADLRRFDTAEQAMYGRVPADSGGHTHHSGQGQSMEEAQLHED